VSGLWELKVLGAKTRLIQIEPEKERPTCSRPARFAAAVGISRARAPTLHFRDALAWFFFIPAWVLAGKVRGIFVNPLAESSTHACGQADAGLAEFIA
jgi:hypothetical protein